MAIRNRQNTGDPREKKVTVSLGEMIRRVREESNLSLRELARIAGVSPAAIQKVENNNVSPTVGTLFQIARGLNKTVSFFLGEEPGGHTTEVSFVPRGKRTLLKTGRSSLRIERMVDNIKDQGIDAHCLIIGPGEGSGEQPLRHPGEEIAICLRGRSDFRVGTKAYRLSPGDTLYFKGSLPHFWSNASARNAEVILVFSPPAIF